MNKVALAHHTIHHASAPFAGGIIGLCVLIGAAAFALGVVLVDISWKHSYPGLYKQAEQIRKARATIRREARAKAKEVR